MLLIICVNSEKKKEPYLSRALCHIHKEIYELFNEFIKSSASCSIFTSLNYCDTCHINTGASTTASIILFRCEALYYLNRLNK